MSMRASLVEAMHLLAPDGDTVRRIQEGGLAPTRRP
jgi:hypothetical protein